MTLWSRSCQLILLSDQHNSSSCITFKFSFKNAFARKTNHLSSNFICQNLDGLFPLHIFNLFLKFASFVLLSSLVAPTGLDYFKMPLFWTTWRKLLVTSVEESELKLFKKKGAGICPHAFCKICVAAMTSLLSGPLANIQVGKLGKIHFEHFDRRWESCWTPHSLLQDLFKHKMWLALWVPLTLGGDRMTLEDVKTPNRAEEQCQSDWIQPSGGSSKAHPPHQSSLV